MAQLAEESPLTPDERRMLRKLEKERELAADDYRHGQSAYIQAKAKYELASRSEKDYRSFLENKYKKINDKNL